MSPTRNVVTLADDDDQVSYGEPYTYIKELISKATLNIL